MRVKKFTAIGAEALKAKTERYEATDGSGLILFVEPSGHKAWGIRYRRPGNKKPAKFMVGEWPAMSLAQARVAAAAAKLEVSRGIDPGEIKKQARVDAAKAAADLKADTFEKHAKQFLEQYAKRETRPGTWKQYDHILIDLVLPKWGDRSIHDIKEVTPVQANRCLSTLSKLFSWLMSRDILAVSPCAGVANPTKEIARDRVLSDTEIAALWHALDAIGGPFAACVKMMLLTGARRAECAGMRHSEVVGDTWVLPPERVKNNRKHSLPLSRQALALIEDQPRLGDGDLLFTLDGRGPITAFSHFKAAVDTIMKPERPWVWHDTRRTVASNMARLGVQLVTVEKVLNHTSGSLRGVAAVYQRHTFANEMRNALQAWADGVERLTRGEPFEPAADDSKIVHLRRA
jgi:integrase